MVILNEHVPQYQDEKVIKVAQESRDKLKSKARYHAVVDFSLQSSYHRFYLVDLKDNEVIYSWFTSHGERSGERRVATSFSDAKDSHKSALGIYKTAEVYYSEKFGGKSLRLDGLDDSNKSARERAIVMHPASYVTKEFVRDDTFPGRSWGCITLDPDKSDWVINLLMSGSLITVINK